MSPGFAAIFQRFPVLAQLIKSHSRSEELTIGSSKPKAQPQASTEQSAEPPRPQTGFRTGARLGDRLCRGPSRPGGVCWSLESGGAQLSRTLPVRRNFLQGRLFCSSSRMAAASVRGESVWAQTRAAHPYFLKELPTPKECKRGRPQRGMPGRGTPAPGDLNPSHPSQTQAKARTQFSVRGSELCIMESPKGLFFFFFFF